jgi:hypothetical protein
MLPRPLRSARLRSALLATALGAGTPACTYDYLGAFEGAGGTPNTGTTTASSSSSAGGGGGSGGSGPVSPCPGAEPGDPLPWLHVMGSKEVAERTHAVVVDDEGSVYVAGAIAGNHEQGLFAQTSGDQTSDAFVAKLSPSGELLWRQRFGTLGSAEGVLDLAARGGVVAISGTSDDGVVIDPSAGPLSGGWLATLSARDGAPIWARAVGSPTEHYPQAVTIGPTGDIILGGRFKGTLTLGPELTATSLATGLDAYIAVFDSTGDARAVKWIQSDEVDRISDVTTDDEGFIYASGTLGRSGATICSLHPNVEDGDALAVKLDSQATCDNGWSNAIGGPLLQMGLTITVGAGNRVYLAGHFTGILRQNRDVYATTPAGTTDGYVMRLAAHDGNGSTATAFGAAAATADDSATAVAATSDGLLMVGFFSQGAHFYEKVGGQAMGGAGGTDFFAAALDAGAVPFGFERFGDAADQWDPPAANQLRVAAVPRGMILAGSLRGNATFGGMLAQSAGDADAWVARLCLPPSL